MTLEFLRLHILPFGFEILLVSLSFLKFYCPLSNFENPHLPSEFWNCLTMPFFSVFVLLFSVFVFFLVLLDPTFCCSLLAILLLLYPHDVSVCRSRAPPLLLVLLHLSVVEVGHVALLLRKDVKTTMASHLSFLLILNSTFFFFCLCASFFYFDWDLLKQAISLSLSLSLYIYIYIYIYMYVCICIDWHIRIRGVYQTNA